MLLSIQVHKSLSKACALFLCQFSWLGFQRALGIIRRSHLSWRQCANAGILLFALQLMCGLGVAQQATSDIVGTVTDQNGAIVVGATVIVTNTGTQETRTTNTSSAGDFSINLLNPGNYSISVSAAGFQNYLIPSVSLAAGDRYRANAKVAVGQRSETVTVDATTPALRTDSSDISSTITEKSVQDLPLNGRNIYQLAQLAPGASQPVAAGGFNSGNGYDDRRPTTAVSVNGQSDIQNNNLVDGVDNNERLVGTIGVRPAIDATSELRLETSNYTADTGRTGGGVIDIITKAGTNTIHGTLYEFFRNDIFDSSPFAFGASIPKAELRQNQYGGSIGGPISKDKTFFFVDYEGLRFVSGGNPSTGAAPTQAQLNNPTSVPGLAAGTTAAQLDPAGVDYFALLPAANTTLPGTTTPAFSGAGKRVEYTHTGDVRVDHVFGPNDTAFARFSYNNVFTNSGGPWGARTSKGLTFDPNSLGSLDIAYSGHLNYIHVFNAKTILELKAVYTRVDNKTYPAGYGLSPNAAFGQANININPFQTSLALAAFIDGSLGEGNAAFLPDFIADNNYVFQGSVVRNLGAHSVKTGAQLIRRQLTAYQSPYGEGIFVFTNYASLLEGQYLETFRTLTLTTPHLRTWEPSAYIQDDWRVNKALTINAGLRYDVFTPYTEVKNQISNFDPSTQQIIVAGHNGVSSSAGVQTDYTNLAPRLGFASTLKQGLVLHGAYGLTFYPENETSGSTLQNQPFTSTLPTCSVQFPYTYFFGQCPGLTTFSQGLPLPTPDGTAAPTAVSAAESRHFRSTVLMQYNLGLEKQIGGNVVAVNYVGSAGRHVARSIPDINSPNQCAGIDVVCTSPRPFANQPQLTSVHLLDSEGQSSYNSAQFVFERRLSRGLSASANYTISHSIDDAPADSNAASGSGYGYNYSKISTVDRGNSDLDVRNHIALSGNYEFQFGKGEKTLKHYFERGWQINSIYVWSSGAPFSVLNATSVSGTSPTIGVGNGDRPDKVGDASVPNRSIGEWFNTNAFAAQKANSMGNEARNSLRGPRFSRLDFSLFRTFELNERYKLEFRAESFNLANHTNFALPNATLGTAQYGQITSTSPIYTPRQLQFALKLMF